MPTYMIYAYVHNVHAAIKTGLDCIRTTARLASVIAFTVIQCRIHLIRMCDDREGF